MMNKWFRFSAPRRPRPAPGQPESEQEPVAREDVVSLDLYEAVVRGERFAINQFGHSVLPLIRSAVQSVLRGSASGNGLLVDDLTQDVFVLLFDNERRALRKWDPERGRTLRGFLYVFARLRAIDRLRAHAYAFPKTELLSSEDLALYAAADPALFDRIELRQFFQALHARLPAHLSEEQRRLLELTIADVPGEEIAKELRKTTANVFQIRKRLRETLVKLRDQILSEERPSPARIRNR